MCASNFTPSLQSAEVGVSRMSKIRVGCGHDDSFSEVLTELAVEERFLQAVFL